MVGRKQETKHELHIDYASKELEATMNFFQQGRQGEEAEATADSEDN